MRERMSPEGKWFTAWIIFCAIFAVIFWGVILWAIIKLVEHFT